MNLNWQRAHVSQLKSLLNLFGSLDCLLKMEMITLLFRNYLLGHLHLQSGVHSNDALKHLHLVHSPLQVHRMSSLHAFATSGMLIHLGTHTPSSIFQENCSGDGIACSESSLVVQIPAWKTARLTCWRSASFRVKWNENNYTYVLKWLKLKITTKKLARCHVYLRWWKLVHVSVVLAKELHSCLVNGI